MSANICRACLSPLNDRNIAVHIFDDVYKYRYNFATIIPDIFQIKVQNIRTTFILIPIKMCNE